MTCKVALTKEKQKLVEEIKELYVVMDLNQKAKCFGITLGIVALLGEEDATIPKIVKTKVNQIYRGEF